ncbi:MAG: NUDIX hydrolase [Candidatus Saccharibacteria bacterium]
MRIIVNKADEIIGYKDSSEIHDTDDIFRGSGLWIENTQGEVLLAQRALDKSTHPGVWGPAVTGGVEEGETYGDGVIRELKEELGLTDVSPSWQTKVFQQTPRGMFMGIFFLRHDVEASQLTLQTEEVEQVAWVEKTALRTDFLEHPENYVPLMGVFLDIFSE